MREPKTKGGEEAIAPADEKPMVRPRIPAAERLIGKKFTALNGQASVMLVDYMGGDAAIVQAARVSYGKGTKKGSTDRGLVRYLARHRHTTPSEMVELKFRMEMPIMVARQWIRHRTANVNELSQRYSIAPDEYYIPEPAAVQAQSKSNKQGREGTLPPEVVDRFRKDLAAHSRAGYEKYAEYLDEGMARELARLFLNLNFQTVWYWKIDLHNLLHFLSLRIDPHAQLEIREIAFVMAAIVKQIAPHAYKSFEDFVLNAVSLSPQEMLALKLIMTGTSVDIACAGAALNTIGERNEFNQKLAKIKDAAVEEFKIRPPSGNPEIERIEMVANTPQEGEDFDDEESPPPKDINPRK